MSVPRKSSEAFANLLTVNADGEMRHMPRSALPSLLRPGDLVIANDAATLPASLMGIHCQSGHPIEVRLAAWVSLHDPTRFTAVAFGAGDYRIRTEDRMPPPPLKSGDSLAFGPLVATVECLVDHPRLFQLHFLGDRPAILAGIARNGRPIQYSHISEPLALWDVWTKFAADPIAFEPPSAGFALDWRTLGIWRERAVGFATLTHAAGISSTGDPALDRRLPFDEHYHVPEATAAAVAEAKSNQGRIIAIGTTVVRALESASHVSGGLRPGDGLARGRIGRETPLCVVDLMLTGIHEPGDSHYQLLQAFVDDEVLNRISAAFVLHRYYTHEFGDSLLIERQARRVAA
jgi:S-adenosylmethionine:tRNA ribosyltransferase-isomerase